MARIAFCQNVMTEYMGYMCMSAVLKQAGHTVEVFCQRGRDEARLAREVAAWRPDIAGFSVLTPVRDWSVRTARRIKERTGAVTLFGNVDPMVHPGVVEEEGVDAVCLWEGEEVLLEMANRLDRGEDYADVRGLWVKREGETARNALPDSLIDLDAQPFHDRALYDKYAFFRHSKYLRAINGRGCPNHCSFCFNHIIRDHFGGMRYVRKRSPESAVRELEHHVARRKVKHIFFADEVLWVRNEWLREFLPLYRDRVGIPFTANYRFGPVEESDIALLAEAGAKVMILAAETADETQRREMMQKNVSNEEVERVAGWLHKYGIEFGMSCFFGIPGDTVEDHVERLAFYRRCRPTYLWTTFFAPYPGLMLTAHPDVQAHLVPDRSFGLTLHHAMHLDLPDKERLERLKRVYYLCMRFPRLSPLLTGLTKYRIPLLFDLLFAAHFSWYAMKFERISLVQFLQHARTFLRLP